MNIGFGMDFGGINMNFSHSMSDQPLKYGDSLHLKSYATNKYVCADMDRLAFNRDEATAWETFNIEGSMYGKMVCYGDRIQLRTFHGKYVCAEPNGVTANRDTPGPWETFILNDPADTSNTNPIPSWGCLGCLMSVHGRYISTSDMTGFSDTIGPSEMFHLTVSGLGNNDQYQQPPQMNIGVNPVVVAPQVHVQTSPVDYHVQPTVQVHTNVVSPTVDFHVQPTTVDFNVQPTIGFHANVSPTIDVQPTMNISTNNMHVQPSVSISSNQMNVQPTMSIGIGTSNMHISNTSVTPSVNMGLSIGVSSPVVHTVQPVQVPLPVVQVITPPLIPTPVIPTNIFTADVFNAIELQGVHYYEIEVNENGQTRILRKRYKEFNTLHHKLLPRYEDRMRGTQFPFPHFIPSVKKSPSTVQSRKVAFNMYVKHLLRDDVLRRDVDVVAFFRQ